MTSHVKIPVAAAALMAACAAAAAAQVIERPLARTDWTRSSRFDVGVDAAYAQAVHDFGRYVDHGWGADIGGLFRLDRRGILGIRGDVTLMEYGSETKRVPLLPSTGRVLVDVTTSNSIVAGSV